MSGLTKEALTPKPERKKKGVPQEDTYKEVEIPTLFQSVVQSIAEGWVNQANWSYSGTTEHRRDEHVWLTVRFKNPSVPMESADTDIKQAFIPEMADIFDGHQRYNDRYHRNGRKYQGVYYLTEMREEVQSAIQAFNVDLLAIHAQHPYTYPNKNREDYVVRYDTGELDILFTFKDLDRTSEKMGEEIKRIRVNRNKLQARIVDGIPINQP